MFFKRTTGNQSKNEGCQPKAPRGENRLHDRFVYARKDSAWEINRLAP
jgi:hypothetical protein